MCEKCAFETIEELEGVATVAGHGILMVSQMEHARENRTPNLESIKDMIGGSFITGYTHAVLHPPTQKMIDAIKKRIAESEKVDEVEVASPFKEVLH